MKIINRKKFIRGLLILIAIISLFVSKSTFSYNQRNYKKVFVSNSETLWDIAKYEVANNDFYKGKDVREVIESIKSINNLRSSNLYEGQELMVEIR